MRVLLMACLTLAACASGASVPATPPATRPATAPATRAATRPIATVATLADVPELIRQNQYEKARVVLERSVKDKDLKDWTRPQVINLAVVDVVQKINAMRAVKNLTVYLAPGAPDEPAVNLLGAALSICGRTRTYANSTLFKEASSQFEQFNAALEGTRPGMRHWGAEWLTAQQFASIERQKRAGEQAYQQSLQRVANAEKALEAAKEKARDKAQVKVIHQHRNTLHGDARSCSECRRARNEAAAADAAKEAERQAERDLKKQQADAEKTRKAIPQPTWPERFEPVEMGDVR
jgi:hypothetical protein